jgi:uncharacterized protein YndB with AHSA1/START domain
MAHDTDTELEFVEVLDGSPDEVWPIVSDPDLLGEWLDDEVELTLRVGGPIRTRGEGGGGRVGVVDDVQVGRRLAFTWAPAAPERGPASTVEFELESDPDGAHTVLRIREHLIDARVVVDAINAMRAIGDSGTDFRALARA